jgi:hypothetical protein
MVGGVRRLQRSTNPFDARRIARARRWTGIATSLAIE